MRALFYVSLVTILAVALTAFLVGQYLSGAVAVAFVTVVNIYFLWRYSRNIKREEF